MDLRQAALGVVLFVVFWAFQAGYLDSLGTTSWVVGAIIFGLVLWLIGKGAMPRQPENMKELWMFTFAFAIVATAILAYGGAYVGTASPAIVTEVWLVLFGGAMFLTGWWAKFGVTTLVGILWLFSAVLLGMGNGQFAFADFGLLTGLPFIIYGIMTKK